jgi:nicotinamide-nucleotide amidase
LRTDGAAPTARILSIGTEILFGEIVDTNAAYLAGELARAGVVLTGIRQLGDDRAAIADAFRDALASVDVVIATGGLGPTHDDLTREGLADALGEELAPDAALADRLLQRFGGAGRMPASNLQQALLVPSAAPLENPIGSAPGWWAVRDGRVAILMPGVPAEMRRMWPEQVLPRLEARFALTPLRTRTVKTFGIGESAVVEQVGDLLVAPGQGIEAGIYARDDGVHLRFSTRAHGESLDRPVARALALLGADVYGTDAQTLPGVALQVLAAAGCKTLATLESGTDGALLATLAGHPAAPGEARFAGGALGVDGMPPPAMPAADAVLRVELGPPGGLGRSRVGVALTAAGIGFDRREVRIHGSGPQRLRRAAFAALDQVRRIASGT